jgi:hypothetical protein
MSDIKTRLQGFIIGSIIKENANFRYLGGEWCFNFYVINKKIEEELLNDGTK